MKTICSFRDLESYGINPLTGEACRYGQRILCDVNEDGKRLLEEFLSVELTSRNWNSKVNGKDAIASIMLPYGILQDLAAFCLCYVDNYYKILFQDGGWVSGVTEEEFDKFGESWRDLRAKTNWGYVKDEHIARGSRNIHQMSGRSH